MRLSHLSRNFRYSRFSVCSMWHIIIRICISFIQMGRLVFPADQYDVIFYYPQHFNRSTTGINLLLDSFVRSCKNNNVKYLLVEEPDYRTHAPVGKEVLHFDCILCLVLLLRKVIKIKDTFEAREQRIGQIINSLTFSRLKCGVYITLSGSMGGMLRGISPEGVIYDYQHGAISSSQPGYFCDKGATPSVKENNKNVLVFGKAFEEIFYKNDSYYRGRVISLGYGREDHHSLVRGGKMIFIAPQITDSMTMERNLEQLQEVKNWLSDNSEVINKYGIKVKLKHHPRYNNCIDDSVLYEFPFVENVTGQWDLLTHVQDIALHVTFYSTTVFDFACYGVPSVILVSEKMPEGREMYGREYEYPFFSNTTLSDWEFLWDESRCRDVSATVRDWYDRFYEPFNEDKFLALL